MTAQRIVTITLGAGLALGIILEAGAFSSLPRVEYRVSAELGEELVVHVPANVSQETAERNFRLQPAVKGRVVWLDVEHELRFYPEDGFAAGQRYTLVWPGPGSLMAKAVPDSGLTFTAAPGAFARAESEVLFEEPLPRSAQASFRKANGEEVALDGPKVTKGKSVEINLKTMIVQLFEDGARVATYEVAGKGNPRVSPTPTGRYKILRKRGLMLSNISYVWMPYSMQFSGPYYLHGPPYYRNGKPVTTPYSGGCVRLGPGVDAAIYEWAQVGTAVVIANA